MKIKPIAAALLTVCSGLASAQTVLTVSSWLPPTHTLSMAQKEWCDLLEKNTAGKMKCNILPRGVTAAPGTMDAVKNGLADVSYTVHGYTPGRFPKSEVFELPFSCGAAEPLSGAKARARRGSARRPAADRRTRRPPSQGGSGGSAARRSQREAMTCVEWRGTIVRS